MTNQTAGSSSTADKDRAANRDLKDTKQKQYICCCYCLCDKPVAQRGIYCGQCAIGNHKAELSDYATKESCSKDAR